MAMWMNEYEIDEAARIIEHHAPELYPYAKYLSDWRDTVNGNSDGWPYWKAGSSCAAKLMELVTQATNSIRGRGEMPSESLFKKALTPIKSAATKFKLSAPELEQPSQGMRM